MTVREAVIPVAGLGTRLLPATRAVPKALLPLVDRPVVELVVDELAAAGVSRFVVVAGRDAEAAVRRHFDGVSAVEVVVQPSPLGLGDAVLHGAAAVSGHPFVVALGDALVGARATERLIEGFAGLPGAAGAAVLVEPVPLELVGRYGIVVPAGEGDPLPLAGLVEKPERAAAPPNPLAIAGRYVLSPAVVDTLRATPPGRGGEVQLTDALDRHCCDGGTVVAVPLLPGERRVDVGDPEGYAGAFVERALGDPRFGARLRSRLAGGDAPR